MAKFSVCISFLNEGQEVVETVKSVRLHSGDEVDIIVVDDCSTDGIDYASLLLPYNVLYHRTPERIGSSAGKHLAVELSKTPYFFILDAHCRIYTSNWLKIAEHELERYPNTVFCCGVHYFDDINGHLSSKHMRAYGSYFDYNIASLLSAKWNLYDFSGAEYSFEVPSILGANYICSRYWWDKIGGHRGLKLYGREEEYVAIKSREAGGHVRCISKILTGHKLRDIVPYTAQLFEIYHNELIIAYVCIPEMFNTLVDVWQRLNNNIAFNKAYDYFMQDKLTNKAIKKEFDLIKQYDYSVVEAFNKWFQGKINFDYRELKRRISGTFPSYKNEE